MIKLWEFDQMKFLLTDWWTRTAPRMYHTSHNGLRSHWKFSSSSQRSGNPQFSWYLKNHRFSTLGEYTWILGLLLIVQKMSSIRVVKLRAIPATNWNYYSYFIVVVWYILCKFCLICLTFTATALYSNNLLLVLHN